MNAYILGKMEKSLWCWQKSWHISFLFICWDRDFLSSFLMFVYLLVCGLAIIDERMSE